MISHEAFIYAANGLKCLFSRLTTDNWESSFLLNCIDLVSQAWCQGFAGQSERTAGMLACGLSGRVEILDAADMTPGCEGWMEMIRASMLLMLLDVPWIMQF